MGVAFAEAFIQLHFPQGWKMLTISLFQDHSAIFMRACFQPVNDCVHQKKQAHLVAVSLHQKNIKWNQESSKVKIDVGSKSVLKRCSKRPCNELKMPHIVRPPVFHRSIFELSHSDLSNLVLRQHRLIMTSPKIRNVASPSKRLCM